jgi:predicted DNA binding protein
LTGARFSSDSSFYALTEKQREMLSTAFKLGYFKVPRAITSGQLAKKFSLSSSAVSERLRNAEQRLLLHSLNE